MCLAVPMEVLKIEDGTAWCSASGIRRAVSLYLLPSDAVAPGDFVLVHVGYAIQKIVAHEARTTWELIDRMQGVEIPKRDARTFDQQGAARPACRPGKAT
ncbi:HypC/HybG/HupF family hydrogenase formation chaperone [Telluria beijingensis]|uniref:HypC/HybG/HupF family hydrogenase formation chaperone n=1 Tax=Telluria beijingensis TaxID=3068633 RepID=UPI002795BD1C|nr:HypC/HybG/HupF family hydrogenase formation chaperone [Massilia sp. REN29]